MIEPTKRQMITGWMIAEAASVIPTENILYESYGSAIDLGVWAHHKHKGKTIAWWSKEPPDELEDSKE